MTPTSTYAFQSATLAQRDDPLWKLANPPPGLRPWPLASENGHLVVTERGQVNPSFSFLQGPSFFHLLAYANVPGQLEREVDAGSIPFFDSLLDQSGHDEMFSGGTGGGWHGGNELETRIGKQLFLRKYAPLLRNVAPRPPFLLHWTEIAFFGQYDAVRGGFPVKPMFSSVVMPTVTMSVTRDAEQQGLTPASGFVVPNDMFWPVPFEEARRTPRQFAGAYVRVGSHHRRLGDRSSISRDIVEAYQADSTAKRVRHDALRLPSRPRN